MTSPIKKIAFSVLGVHIVLLVACLWTFSPPTNTKKTPLAIRTFSSSQYTYEKPQKMSQKPAATCTPQKKTSVSKKKQSSPPSVPPLNKKKLSQQKEKMQKELQEIQKTIAKIEEENDRMGSKSLLREPPKILFEKGVHAEEISSAKALYITTLTSYLKTHLQLPSHGEVKVRLIIKKDGSVASLEVLYAKSEKNRKRLEEEIPKLFFPPIKYDSKGKELEVFILTFDNQE